MQATRRQALPAASTRSEGAPPVLVRRPRTLARSGYDT